MFDTARQQFKAQLATVIELGIGALSALGVPMALILGKLLLAGLLGMIVVGLACASFAAGSGLQQISGPARRARPADSCADNPAASQPAHG